MKSKIGLSLLVASLAVSPAWAQESAPGDEPGTSEAVPPSAPDDLGIGDTSVGEETDLGTPDPLNALDAPPPEIQAMPEFNEVPPENAEVPAPAPEAPAVENAEAPPAPEPVLERQADGPDFRRERNFHGIYKKYNENPTPLEQWEQASSSRQSQIYKVQKGDTLWDLSSALFGQADYWPKIWALNKDEVTNPHQIETWMQIRFFPGDLMEAPTLAVTETSPATPLAAGEDVPASDASLIPPARGRAPVVRNLPKSLPIYKPQIRLDPVTNFEGLKPPQPLAKPNAPLAYYIIDGELPSVGTIKEAELGGMTASEYQYVYVELANPSDRILSVVREVGVVNHDGSSGKIIEVQGEIEIIDPAGENGLHRAIVRRNLSPVEVGSHLVAKRIEEVNTRDETPVSGPSVQIIGAQFSLGRSMADAEGLLFLSGGRGAGVQAGQVYAIYANRQLRVPGSLVTGAREVVGHVRIAHVTENFATAFVTSLRSEILVGDLVGSPGLPSPSPLLESADDFEDEPAPRAAAPAAGSNAEDFELDSDFETEFESESAPAPDSGSGSDSEFDDFSL